MRLLIFVNKFDEEDDLLGFFPGWARELAGRLDGLIVVAQKAGRYEVLPNLRVISLNKELNKSPAVRIFKLNKLLFSLRNDYDAVLVVMAPAWVIASAPAAKLLGKKIYLWYAVWRGNWKLRLAEKMVDKIFCSVKESFPFSSRKVFAIGQGIDTDKFLPDANTRKPNSILYLGRISPVKKLELLFRAIRIMKDKDGYSYSLIRDIVVAGEGVSDRDRIYIESLKKMAGEMGLSAKIIWKGRVPHSQVANHYKQGDIFVNATPTGSFDKAMLEAMACGDIVLASNRALHQFLAPGLADKLIFNEDDPADLAKKLAHILNLRTEEKNVIRAQLREMVVRHHSQKQWAIRLIAELIINS